SLDDFLTERRRHQFGAEDGCRIAIVQDRIDFDHVEGAKQPRVRDDLHQHVGLAIIESTLDRCPHARRDGRIADVEIERDVDAGGIPCTLPLPELAGVFMSPCASTQMRPSGRSSRRTKSAVAATDPAARLWSPPSTRGKPPFSSTASDVLYSFSQTRAISRMY